MNYPQALATVEVVSEQLGHRIEEALDGLEDRLFLCGIASPHLPSEEE